MKKIILSLSFAVSTLFAVFAANPESDFDYVFLDNHEKGWLSFQTHLTDAMILAEWSIPT